jgi:hypothetical protein
MAIPEFSIGEDIAGLEGKHAGYSIVILELRHDGIARATARVAELGPQEPTHCVRDRLRSTSAGDSSKSIWLCAADAARRKINCVQGLLPHDIDRQRKPPRPSSMSEAAGLLRRQP